MKHIGKTKIALLAACSLTSVAHAATLVYTTDTTLTTAASVGANSLPGFQVTSGATLTINSGGSLSQADQNAAQTTLLLGTADGLNSGNLEMNVGSSITATETGGNIVTGIEAYGSSIATINGGILSLVEVGNPAVADNLVAFRAFDSSEIILNGGSFTLNEDGGGNITPFFATDNAIVRINGGAWTFTNALLGSNAPLAFNVSGSAQVILNGAFNFGIGAIDEATDTGTITGTLANGDAFSMLFDKTAGGTITIIPEPSAALLGGLGLLALLRRRRH